MTEPIEPIHLAADSRKLGTAVLSRAFLGDPLYRYIFPDNDERSLVLSRLFGAVVGYSLKFGLVHSTASVEGVACWLSPGNTKVTFWRMFRTGMAFQRAVGRIQADARGQLLDALAYTDGIHKRLLAGNYMDSHWYLWALGVDPEYQGRGIGGKLIQPVLILSDRSGNPCYLETFNERNVAFYERWGFEVRIEEVVPGTEVEFWSMIREPQP